MKPKIWNFLTIAGCLWLLAPGTAAIGSTLAHSTLAHSTLGGSTLGGTGSRIPSNPAIAENTPSSQETEETEETSVSPEESEEKSAETESEAEDASVSPENEADGEEAALEEDPDDLQEKLRLQTLIEGDKLYEAGDYVGAEELYRRVKPPFDEDTGARISSAREPFADPELLSPAGRVYWREAHAGLEKNLETRIFVPLELLVTEIPEFLPGHLLLAKAHVDRDRPEKAAIALQRATTLYPNEVELLESYIQVLVDTKQWLEASIAARRFALLNPTHTNAEKFGILAEEYLGKFRSYMRKLITSNAIANVITGAVGVALTGNPLGAFSAVETLTLLARGESGIGDAIAKDAREQLDMVEDEEILEYVNQLGQKLAISAGRDDFEYEFFVIKDPRINAFALPGGKIFVNAGAILNTDTEAELAGLLAHELAHAVLSHGFQLVTHGNLVSSMTRYVPFGGTLSNLLVLDYSRDMERQADLLGTRTLAAAGYAADGLRNLMVVLNEEYGSESPVFKGLSTHPPTQERIDYLESLISSGSYNRYAFEGVERHQEIRKQLISLIEAELEDSELEDTELEDAELEDTELEDAELENTELENTELENTELENTELEDAVEDTELEDAVEDTELEDAKR